MCMKTCFKVIGSLFMSFLEYKHPKSFSWEKYLEETGTQAAPARAFKQVRFQSLQWTMRGVVAKSFNIIYNW